MFSQESDKNVACMLGRRCSQANRGHVTIVSASLCSRFVPPTSIQVEPPRKNITNNNLLAALRQGYSLRFNPPVESKNCFIQHYKHYHRKVLQIAFIWMVTNSDLEVETTLYSIINSSAGAKHCSLSVELFELSHPGVTI